MARAIISPCLYMYGGDIINFFELETVLSFIEQYLDIGIDNIDGSILGENNWYKIPPFNLNLYNSFTTVIVPLLTKLRRRGNDVAIDTSDIEYSIDAKYAVSNETEVQCIVKYITQTINQDNVIMFVGNINRNIGDYLNFTINDSKIKIPVITDVWLDESGNFNSYLLEKDKPSNKIFPHKDVCSKLAEYVYAAKDASLYSKYGDIIAQRNGYYKLPYSTNQYKNVPYYRSKDKTYTICIDLLHGTYEVFKKSGHTYEDYQGEYGFDGNHIENKLSTPENHKCYRKY